MNSKLTTLLARIDEANARDPNQEEGPSGVQPAALLYSRRMTHILNEFAPQASEELTIAARGQHIERWQRPRSSYSDGREGYLNWRKDAAKFHASRIEALMQDAGYDAVSRDRVVSLMLKRNLKTDPDAQTLEDIACLVFFRWYAGNFSEKHEAERILTIVTKTARKMSAKGRAAALALGLPSHVGQAITLAD
ncbi:MAG: DUF4202 domain-containing protein [Hyphomicrobium sp.]